MSRHTGVEGSAPLQNPRFPHRWRHLCASHRNVPKAHLPTQDPQAEPHRGTCPSMASAALLGQSGYDHPSSRGKRAMGRAAGPHLPPSGQVMALVFFIQQPRHSCAGLTLCQPQHSLTCSHSHPLPSSPSLSPGTPCRTYI